MIYLNPRPAPAELSRIYPSSYHAFNFSAESFGIVYRIRRRLEARRLKARLKGLPANARILDVGCGDGFHLRLLRDFGEPGWSIEGIDTDARAVDAAKKAHLDVRQGEIGDLALAPASYDAVLLIMTIEHVADPARLVASIARLLKPEGKLLLVTDNAASLDARLFGGRYWGGYHFPRHFYLFNSATLTKLAERAGLTAESVTTGFSPVNWTYSFRNLLDDWGAPRWLVNRFSLSSAPVLALMTALDIPLSFIGRGGILCATFVRNKAAAE